VIYGGQLLENMELPVGVDRYRDDDARTRGRGRPTLPQRRKTEEKSARPSHAAFAGSTRGSTSATPCTPTRAQPLSRSCSRSGSAAPRWAPNGPNAISAEEPDVKTISLWCGAPPGRGGGGGARTLAAARQLDPHALVDELAQVQGLTLVHFSAQLKEPCLSQENTLHTLNAP
jgi:hypothetical protein